MKESEVKFQMKKPMGKAYKYAITYNNDGVMFDDKKTHIYCKEPWLAERVAEAIKKSRPDFYTVEAELLKESEPYNLGNCGLN